MAAKRTTTKSTRSKERKPRVRRQDIDEIGPRKIEPGISGRTRWFTERAGYKADARSTTRLLKAVKKAELMAEVEDGKQRLREAALTLLAQANLAGDAIKAPLLLTPTGRVRRLKTVRIREQEGLSALTHPIQLPKLDDEYAILVIPLPPNAAEYLALDKLIGANWQDRSSPRLLPDFLYLPNEGVVVGWVNRPGLIQAYALPKHPWLRLAYDVLARHWKYILLDPVVRERAKREGENIPLVDRICQLILCTGDFINIQDPLIFSRAGLAFPPGYVGPDPEHPLDPGIPPGLGGSGGDICERCLGNFLGEFDLIDHVIIMPPVLKLPDYPEHLRPCSQWTSIGPVPAAGFGGIGRVTQLASHPSSSNMLVAAAAGGGVWRTGNGATSWEPLMELQPTLTMGAVAIAPSNPYVIYAASGEDADGWNPAWGGVGVYRSNDSGKHWTICTSVPSTAFSAIIVHPNDPNTIYVAGDRGLHKSADGGATWITNPGAQSLFDGRITDVVIAHDDPSRLYIGVWSDGVYRTTSGGEQVGMTPAFTRFDGANQLPFGGDAGWTKLAIGRAGTNGSNFVVAKLGNEGSRIFRTRDGGNIWTELAANVASVDFDEWTSVIAVDPTDENVMYAGNNAGLMRTTNGGATLVDWTSVSVGIHSDQQDLVFDPNNSHRIFLANDGGVFRSENRGDNWTFASGMLAITQLYDIDISERDPDVVMGGAQDNGIYYRNVAGVWRHIPWGDGTQVAIDPTDPNIIYFSSQRGLQNGSATNIRKSVNGGAGHQAIGQVGLSGSSPWVTIIKLDPTDPLTNPSADRTLFVCGFNELFRSTNGGQTWKRVEGAGGIPFQTLGTITALEFAPSNPSILYLGTSIGELYRGVNGGASATNWTRLDLMGTSADMLFPNAQIQSLAVNPKSSNDVWVVFGGAGVNFTGRPNMILNPLGISHVFRSRDGGANWVDASGQFSPTNLPDVPTSAVAISDIDSELAYAGTDVGVFRTVDGGETWTAFQDGLPRSPITELKFNRHHNRLFAATMGRGVYIRDV